MHLKSRISATVAGLALLASTVVVPALAQEQPTSSSEKVTPAAVSADTSTYTDTSVKSGDNPSMLTTEQRTQFIEGAKKVGNLTDAQIDTALKNPNVLSGTAVSVENYSNTDQPSSKPSSGVAELQSGAVYCRTASNWMTYYNIFHQQLAKFKMDKYWCWNGHAVTNAPAPKVTATVTRLGAATGWDYQGVINKNDNFYYLNGNSHGGHYSYRQGKFKTCLVKIGCYQENTPQLEIWGHYNGSFDHRERG